MSVNRLAKSNNAPRKPSPTPSAKAPASTAPATSTSTSSSAAPSKDARVGTDAASRKAAQKRAVGGQSTVETFARNAKQAKAPAHSVPASSLQAAQKVATPAKPAPAPTSAALVADLKTQSPAIRTHMEGVERGGTKVDLVKDDPSMHTDAFFDTKTNTIKVKQDADPSVMKDNILYESCNAAHAGEFKRINRDFNNGKLTPHQFGEQFARTELHATTQYVDLANSVSNKSALPPRAQKATAWAETNAPGYSADPVAKRPLLEKSFMESPHDAKATGGPASLPTPQMYAYEKIQGYQDRDMRRTLQHAVTDGGKTAKPDGYNAFVEANVSGKFDRLSPDARPAVYQKVLEDAGRQFRIPPSRLDNYLLTPEMKAL